MVDHWWSGWARQENLGREQRSRKKDFGQVCDDMITRMKITADSEKLLVGDCWGYLKLISSRDGKLIKDFGEVHANDISGIVITEDEKFFFTSSYDGFLKQWNYKDNTLVKDYGQVFKRIIYMYL
jgi:WD40 repeat protein